MPCQSYESNWAYSSSDSDVKRLKKEADKLARIACKALTELIKHGKADFLILQDDEVREWWEAHQEADRKEREREAERARKKAIKEQALARLTEEEKEVLGIGKKKSKNEFTLSQELVKIINSPIILNRVEDEDDDTM